MEGDHLEDRKRDGEMSSYGSLFTVMLLDLNKGVEYHIYTLELHLPV